MADVSKLANFPFVRMRQIDGLECIENFGDDPYVTSGDIVEKREGENSPQCHSRVNALPCPRRFLIYSARFRRLGPLSALNPGRGYMAPSGCSALSPPWPVSAFLIVRAELDV